MATECSGWISDSSTDIFGSDQKAFGHATAPQACIHRRQSVLPTTTRVRQRNGLDPRNERRVIQIPEQRSHGRGLAAAVAQEALCLRISLSSADIRDNRRNGLHHRSPCNHDGRCGRAAAHCAGCTIRLSVDPGPGPAATRLGSHGAGRFRHTHDHRRCAGVGGPSARPSGSMPLLSSPQHSGQILHRKASRRRHVGQMPDPHRPEGRRRKLS